MADCNLAILAKGSSMRLLRVLLATFSELRDAFVISKYVMTVEDYAKRAGLHPHTADTLMRYVVLDRPSDVIRSLLAAYDLKVEPAAQYVAVAGDANESGAAPPALDEIVAYAYLMARECGRGSRALTPAEILVGLATHRTTATTLNQFGLTRLRITYFLSHGRALPAIHDDEPPHLPERCGEIFVRIRNDDYTPMDLVTKILTDVFALGIEDAKETMRTIHRSGDGFVGPYPYEEARTRAAKATAVAREAGAPLLLLLARENSIGTAAHLSKGATSHALTEES